MNNNKIAQQKYYQREKFTSADRHDVLRKSNGVCSHCGKELSNYNMTIDHFIPLFKGGSNRSINLIPLCENCNKAKDDKLYPIDYVLYLKKEHKDELEKYLNSYIAVTDCVQRHRLLIYDEYDDYVMAVPYKFSYMKNKKLKGIKTPYSLKLATWDDVNRLTDYLIKYLKKYNALDNEESAKHNIVFWLQFGCIYYVERDNDIKIMFAITIKHLSKSEDFRGIDNQPYIYVFSYYLSDLTYNILLNTLYTLPYTIMKENNLKFMPVNVLFIKSDKLKDAVCEIYGSELVDDAVSIFSAIHGLIGDIDDKENSAQDYENMTSDEKQVYDFFKSFDNVTEEIISYFEKYSNSDDISWMLNSLFSAEIILEDDRLLKLVKCVEIQKKESNT